MTKKQADNGVVGAVKDYLDELTLKGAQRPMAATALLLAESLEAAPEYARARLARELLDLLSELDEKALRDREMAERRKQRERSRAWAASE